MIQKNPKESAKPVINYASYLTPMQRKLYKKQLSRRKHCFLCNQSMAIKSSNVQWEK